MKTFKIATWNINSLRVRLPHVLEWLASAQPDLLALQELKIPTEDFPFDIIQNAGYGALVNGQKTYNGVAFLYNIRSCGQTLGKDVITELPMLSDPQRRVIVITLKDIRVLNLYVPNGESIHSEKYQYKLNWLSHLRHFIQYELKQHNKMIILGDLNIAPENQDVYDPATLQGHILFSEAEREEFQKILALGFKDCFRLHPQPEKSYSWWDYRMNAFKRKMGLRIDHILATTTLAETCTHCTIDKTPRGAERPSDHAPMIAEFALL